MIPSTVPNLLEYVTGYMADNNGDMPPNAPADFYFQHSAKIDKYRAKVLGGAYVVPEPF